MLTKNPPDKRFAFIVKTYIDKQPWVVWDTLSVIFNTIGIDQPAQAVREAALDGVAPPQGMTNKQLWMELSDVFHAGSMRSGLPDPRILFDMKLHPHHEQMESYTDLVYIPYNWGDPLYGRRMALDLLVPLLMNKEFASGLMTQPNESDYIFPWVARELSRLSKRTIAQADQDIEEKYSPRDTWLENYFDVLEELRDRANAIAAWAQKNRIDINKLSLAEALEESKDFRNKVAVPQGTIVKKFESGWTVQELRGRGRLDPEGRRLQHCVGSYCSAVERGESQIYSLRDPDGVPYVTMEVDPKTDKFQQVYGLSNSKVGSNEFNEYVFTEGQENDPPLAKSEVPEVVEAIKDMLEEFIDERSNGDLQSLAMANIDMTPRVEAAFRAGQFFSLSGMTLKSINLSGIDLGGLIMEETTFESSDLSGVKMDNVSAVGAAFLSCNMRGADMMSASVQSARFEGSDLSGANMAAIKCADANFNEATMTGVDMRFAYAWNAKFVRADLRGANLSSATISHANFAYANLSRANLSKAKDIDKARFVSATYDDATKFPEGFAPYDEGMQFGGPTSEEGQDFAQRERLMEAYRGTDDWDERYEPEDDDEDDEDEDEDDDW